MRDLPQIIDYDKDQLAYALANALKERDEAREELARIESLLLDPHAVFLNFLHGKIAKLDWAKLEHIHGPHPARVERDEAREVLREIAEASGFDNIGNWARNKARNALYR